MPTNKFCLLFLVVFNVSCIAQEVSSSQDEHSNFTKVLFIEGLFIGNAYLATVSPEVYGAILTLGAPLGGSSEVSDTTNLVNIGVASSLGLYNAMELNSDKYSKSDVFMKNMFGWHLFAVSSWLSEKLSGNKETVAYIAPYIDGAALAVNHRF